MRKKRLLRIVLINLVLLAGLLAAAELILRETAPPPPPEQPPPLGLRPEAGDHLYVVDQGRIRTNPKFRPAPNDPDERGFIAVDLPHPKPADVRRIVMVGSSPMRGGTQPGQSTADYLQRELDRLAPAGRYVVIDASLPQGFADNVAWTLDQIDPLAADLIVLWPAAAPVIYADMEQNLFGDSGVRGRILTLLETTRTYEALRDMLHSVAPERTNPQARPSEKMTEDPGRVDPDLAAFLQRLNHAAASAYAHFLESSLQTTAKKKLRTVVIIPPTCVACVAPLFSIHDGALSPADAKKFAAHLEQGAQLLKTGRPDEAARELERAKRIDPTYARARWLLGRALRETGQDEAARIELAAAVEHDASIETVKEPPDATTRAIAEKYDTLVFDLETFVVDNLPDGIVDARAMIDLTHLSLDFQARFTQALAAQIHEDMSSN